MKPESRSRTLLAITRAKSKMFEYGLAESEHIQIPRDPARLLRLAVGMLGDLAAGISAGDPDTPKIAELSSSLRFAARYFDAYLQTRLAPTINPHLSLLASASYYLCDLPGSSAVLVSQVQTNTRDLAAGGLADLVRWLLDGQFSSVVDVAAGRYQSAIRGVVDAVLGFYSLGAGRDAVWQATSELRRLAYAEGTPRELLFSDAACAIARRRFDNSARSCLPRYSALPVSTWEPVLAKHTFVRELWPAQRLLGERGVFAGSSAIVQMPTSAGKSRATELVIRSAFLAGRASLAIVVAPFRALCHEIRESLDRAFQGEAVRVNELSDVFQEDFDIDDLLDDQGVVVVTPEKLLYVLRHAPTLADQIGLLVFDEGHQFDVGARGVTYELLLTSLKGMIPPAAQKVLISAVISNATEIGQWLNGDNGSVISGTHLLPTERSVAFASWQTQFGQLQFVVPEDPDQQEFFVPRVIRTLPLERRGKERNARFFPEKGDSQSVALYLGIKLVPNGAVAIFCGRKATATGLCETLVDNFDRQLAMPKPLEVSDADEVGRLGFLYEQNLNADAHATRAAKIGVLSHHGNTPHGVRLAVEYAMKEGLARFVLCTSTLAQGVNLPIRYLIITSTRQGGEQIKVRDFHNLIGRAGRSGIHTEGSVLFANPEIYDGRGPTDTVWPNFKALLQVKNSEPCTSTLLSVLGSLQSDGGQLSLSVDPLRLAGIYVDDREGTAAWVDDLAATHARKWFSVATLRSQLAERRDIFAAIESFLLAHWEGAEVAENAGSPAALAMQTLAYHLASAEQRVQLLQLFALLATNIATRVSEPATRKVFGRTLYGLGEAMALEAWVVENIEKMVECTTEEELLAVVWRFVAGRVRSENFKKWRPSDSLETLAAAWIQGISFGVLFETATTAGVRIGLGQRPRRATIEHIVELGESAFGFDGALALGGIIEICNLLRPEEEKSLVALLQKLQKRLKYGLPSQSAVLLYELGFADRVLAIDLARLVEQGASRSAVIRTLRSEKEAVQAILAWYPQYFSRIFERVAQS